MDLGTLLYKIEGEIEGALAYSTRTVLIVTDDGHTYAPEQVSSDGEVLIVNARRDPSLTDTLNPPDAIACGAPTDVKLCPSCIDAYRNGIEPGESYCEHIMALLSPQGTACGETALRGHDDTPERRAEIERQIDPTDPDAPVPGTWTDVSDNDAIREGITS